MKILLNYLPYVLPFPMCLAWSCAPGGLAPHVPRALNALVPHVPHALCALVPRALRALLPTMLLCPTCPTCLVFHIPRSLRAPVFHLSCTLMWPHALRFMSLFLRTLLFRTLRTLCANIIFFCSWVYKNLFWSIYQYMALPDAKERKLSDKYDPKNLFLCWWLYLW